MWNIKSLCGQYVEEKVIKWTICGQKVVLSGHHLEQN